MRKQALTNAEQHTRSYGTLTLLAGNTDGLMKTANADLKLIDIRSGESTSYHSHLISQAFIHVVKGKVAVRVESGDRIEAVQGDTIIVEPGEFHQLTNTDSSTTTVLEVQSPTYDNTDKYPEGFPPGSANADRPEGRFWKEGPGTRIKICGITSLDAAYSCHVLGADAVGIQAFGQDAMAKIRSWSRWLKLLPEGLSVFLLTDRTRPGELVDLLSFANADAVQLAGPMAVKDVQATAALLHERGWKVVKSVGLRDLPEHELMEYVTAIAPHTDALLLDTAFYGGTGERNNWELCQKVKTQLGEFVPKLIVAGGLRSDEVGAVLDTVHPYGVDVESSVHVAQKKGELKEQALSLPLVEEFIRSVQSKDSVIS